MPGVLRRQPLADEDVAEVATTSGTLYFDALTVGIRESPNGALDLLIEGWPAATGLELRIRNVERHFAAATDVSTLREEIVILARERAFSPFMDDYARLVGVELVECLHS